MSLAAIAKVLQLVLRIGTYVKIGKFLWNAPKIYKFVKRFGNIADFVLREHRLPNGPERLAFLNATAELVRAQIVDFPGVDEEELAKKIEEFALELESAA